MAQLGLREPMAEPRPDHDRRPTRELTAEQLSDLAPDVVIDGRYRIEEVLGTGGVGCVYRARHVGIGRDVAIKVLAPEWADHHSMPARFRKEARVASAAGHPGIVEVFDVGALPDGRPYLVMEYVRGRALSALRNTGEVDPLRACRIVRDIARAVAAAHAVGVVHRDLKPDNVMLVLADGEERVKVLDFGIAHAYEPIVGRLTRPGTVLGTAEYMAPEQVAGAPTRPTFDVYAMGVLLFELLAGRVPFDGDTAVEIAARKRTEDPPSLATERPDLPAALLRVVDRCMHRDPEVRPESAAVLAESLDAIVADLVTDAPAGSRPVAAAWHRRLVLGAAVVGAAVLLGLGIAAALDAAPSGAAAAADAPAIAPGGPTVRSMGDRSADDPDPASIVPASAGDGRDLATVPTSPDVSAPTLALPTAIAGHTDDVGTSSPSTAATDVDCARQRRRADTARRRHRWRTLLRLTAARRCFAVEERVRLRTKAYMELERFDRCVQVGNTDTDPDVQRWVQLCEQRRK